MRPNRLGDRQWWAMRCLLDSSSNLMVYFHKKPLDPLLNELFMDLVSSIASVRTYFPTIVEPEHRQDDWQEIWEDPT